MPESTPDQPGGQTTQHQPGDSHGDSVSSHQPGDQQVGAMPSEAAAEPGQTERKFVQPSEEIQAEVRERPDHVPTAPPAQAKPIEAPVPEVFKQPPPPEPEPQPQPAAVSAANTATVSAPSRPSGRWQAFWFAISALTLWFAISVTSLAVRQGILRRLLINLTDKSGNELFGTQSDVFIAQAGLSVMLVAIPLFIVSTVFVDRYRSVHSDLDTSGMKKIAYFFMALAILSIIGSLIMGLYIFVGSSMHSGNILSMTEPVVEIFFVLIYIYWLYATVAEDRKS